MALVKCEDCGHQVSTEAAACPSCGRPMKAASAPTPPGVEPTRPILPGQQPAAPAQPTTPNPPATPKKKNWFRRHPILTVILGVIVLGIIGAAASSGNKKHGSGSSGASLNNPPAASTPITPPASTSTPPASRMTAAQQQAVESARNYLSLGTGFSRAGLIQQLSSSDGSGFPRAVAIFAVDHLHVNWNEQAVEAAKNYMSLGTGFSRAGLIQQLSSSDGSGFTPAQAVYAANKVGL